MLLEGKLAPLGARECRASRVVIARLVQGTGQGQLCVRAGVGRRGGLRGPADGGCVPGLAEGTNGVCRNRSTRIGLAGQQDELLAGLGWGGAQAGGGALDLELAAHLREELGG